MLIILSGYTAVGKDTYQEHLLKRNVHLKRAVSHTTRPKRPQETDGLEYYFINQSEFINMLYNNELIEHRSYQTFEKGEKTIWHYGLAKKTISSTDTFIVIVDHNGAKELIEALGRRNVKIVYLKCDISELRHRSLKREDERQEFERRLQDDIVKFKNIENIADLILDINHPIDDYITNINAIEALLEDSNARSII